MISQKFKEGDRVMYTKQGIQGQINLTELSTTELDGLENLIQDIRRTYFKDLNKRQ